MIHSILPGKIAWFVTGRFYFDENGAGFDAGYFSHIQGISGSLFAGGGSPSEQTAMFTFSAIDDPFSGTAFSNGDLNMTYYPKGTWKMYYNESPKGNWDDPSSFSPAKAKHIATFQRPDNMTGIHLASSVVSILSFKLIESNPFDFGKKKDLNLKTLVPNGVSQFGFANPITLDPLPKYPTVSTFSASAIAVG